MRILYIQDSLGTGGAERSNADLWYFLRGKGVEIRVIVLEHRKEGVEEEVLRAGLNVKFLNSRFFFTQVKEIIGIIKEFKPHLVHSTLFRAALRTRTAKLVVSFMNVESLVNATYDEIRYEDPNVNGRLLKLYEKIDRFSQSRGVDHFIAITEEVARHYRRHLNIRKEKITVIYRGRKENTNLPNREQIRKNLKDELGMEGMGITFIHVGRQEFQKAHLDILKAITIVDKQLSAAGVSFLFCGRKGNASLEIEKFLQQHNIKTTIKFLGHRNDVYELLAASDVFVFPSLFEGLGGALIEAQAAGLPIICSNIPVFREVITEENALVHRVNDPESLSEQFIQILKMDHEKMGEKSLENFLAKFQLQEVNRSVFQLYKNLITGIKKN